MDKIKLNTKHITDFPNGIYMYGKEFIKTGTTVSMTTPDFVGQIYIQTDNSQVYMAVAANSSDDWAFLGSAGV